MEVSGQKKNFWGDLDAKEIEKVREWRAVERERPVEIAQPKPGQESVWDYPRPPEVQIVDETIRVEFGDSVIAESRNALRVIETAGAPVYYLPPEDVNFGHLEPSRHRSLCEWKGRATYWHVRVGNRLAHNAAWSYPHPLSGYEHIQDYLAFYAQKMDACFVGDEEAKPQPGNFYGGWITSKVVGPFKGEPGTSHW